jgi:hypothetical protein
VAWMRMMGAESVTYHRDTIIGRGDDHPGAALAYYAFRGETPLAGGRDGRLWRVAGSCGHASPGPVGSSLNTRGAISRWC